MLIIPADAFLPNSVDCGPRNTSTRLILGRSPIWAAERERYTPSMNTPTEGSMPALFAPLPKPRMMKLVFEELCSWPTFSEGTKVCKSIRSRICDCSICALLATATEIGVSCSVFSRFDAVTMISAGASSSAAAVLAAGAVLWANAGLAANIANAVALSSSNFFMTNLS